MTTQHEPSIARRSYLKGAGATLVTIGGMTGLAVGKGQGTDGRGPKPLEDTPSQVSYAVYLGQDGLYADLDPDATGPDGDLNDQVVDFGFPQFPAAKDTHDTSLFNTTIPTITPNGKTLHYFLQFGTSQPKPYILLHEGNGVYTSRGAVVNFEWNGEGPLPLPLPEGSYRGVVRDIVHLYEPAGYFDWSVTRTDFFSRERGMHPVASLIYLVWDEDGSDNSTPLDRGNPPIPDEPLGSEMSARAIALITSGVANPGGQ